GFEIQQIIVEITGTQSGDIVMPLFVVQKSVALLVFGYPRGLGVHRNLDDQSRRVQSDLLIRIYHHAALGGESRLRIRSAPGNLGRIEFLVIAPGNSSGKAL